MRILAQIKGRLGKTNDSVDLLKKVLELNPKDFEANIEIGQVYEQNDPKTASIYYEKALKVIEELIEEGSVGFKLVPPELLVSIGTLRLEIGKKDDAKIAYDMAIENCDKLINDMPVQEGEEYKKLMAIRITARFNLGYWHEMNLDLDEAKLIYNDIIRIEVSYLDAYLRLAYMANKKGRF